MVNISLSSDEWRMLQDYKQSGPYRLIRLKSEALVLLHEGIGLPVVGRIVERSEETVKDWCKAWDRERLGSIRTGHAGNVNASKLTADQREEVRRVLQKPPSDYDLPVNFWSVPDLATWIYTKFGVQYVSPSSYYFYMHDAGLSFHRPETHDKRRLDPEAVTQRMEEITTEVAQLLTQPDTIVVSADEVRIEHEAIIRRAWYQKGTKTKLAVDRQRQAQSYIGFLHETDGHVDLCPLDWQDTEHVTQALIDLTLKYPGKRIAIVWDNARWHRSKGLREHLGQNQLLESIHLINLPPYCPDHNPIEHVWGEAKDSISNIQRGSFAETRGAFENFVRTSEFPYRLLPKKTSPKK